MTPLDIALLGCTLGAVIVAIVALAGNAQERHVREMTVQRYREGMEDYRLHLIAMTGERNAACGEREYYRLQMLMAVAALQQQSETMQAGVN